MGFRILDKERARVYNTHNFDSEITLDITSPNSLWKDYDVSALPLNVTELSTKNVDGLCVREFYFDGFTAVDGKVRAFMRVYEKPSCKGVVLLMSDIHGAKSKSLINGMINRGYSVAELDYAGKSDTEPRFTIYPASVSVCNSRHAEKFVASGEALKSRWYIWTCIARKAVYLIGTLYPESKRFALGIGIGGSTVYKLGAFDDGLTACATLLNIIPDMSGTGTPLIVYRAALDNSAYAPLLKTPLFMAVCSNDEDGSFDKMSELAQTTASLKCLRIVERAFADGIKVVYDQIDAFFTAFANGTPNIPTISVKPVNSENNLYFNIKVESDATDVDGMSSDRINFYAAFCITDPTNRNWTHIKTLNLGSGEYMAHVDVLQNDKPAYGFINLTDANGHVVSTPLLTVIPKSLGIPAQQAVKRRLIYDGSMGNDVWLAPRGGEVKTVSGPVGIDGVTSDNNTLITFKPGDLLYRAEDDALLQIMIYGKCKELHVSVSDGTEIYTCDIDVPETEDWNKYTLSQTDFKSANGILEDWSKVIMLKFAADGEFLVSTVLWV